MDLRSAARALDGEVSAGQILCPGPNHSKKDRSLSVKFDGANLKVFSHAGDDWRDCLDHVRSRLGMPAYEPQQKDDPIANMNARAARAADDDFGFAEETVAENATVADPPRENEDRGASGWRPIVPVPSAAPTLSDDVVKRFAPDGYTLAAGYVYTSEEGEILGWVARFDRRVGDVLDKQFRPFVFCQGSGGKQEWRCQGFPTPRPLFGLRAFAARPTAPVLVVEGEKTALAARSLCADYIVLTSSNGSKGARKADWSSLSGRRVVIWPDADAPGAAYANDVVEFATAAGATSVGVVKLPLGLPIGWDLADDLPLGMSQADVMRLITDARTATADGPLPLFPDLPPAEPFPIAALGPVLARAAAAIARKVQCPEAIAGQSVLAAAALAAQAHADVMMPYGQTRPLSLFFVTVAASGDRKSSGDNEALWPVVKREKVLREENQHEMASWRIAQGAWVGERKKIEADKKIGFEERKSKLEILGDEPPRPLAPFLTSGDLTIEGLTKNWSNAHAALGIFSAEAGQFSGGHAMSEDNRLKTAAMLSEVWDGKPIKRVRAMDGVTILPGRRLSMHLLVQPDAAAGFLSNTTLRDQGLLSRVLVAAPTTLSGSRLYREPTAEDDTAIHAYGARILSLLEEPPALTPGTLNELEPREIRLSGEASKAWRAFYNHIESQCGSYADLKPIFDFAAKAAEHAARIAGVLTIVDSLHAHEIGLDAMRSALALVDWYVAEALRLQQGARTNPKLILAAALLDWMQERGGEVELRDILRLGPGPLRTKQAAEEAITTLMAHGWLTETSPRPRRFGVMPKEPK